MRTLLFLWDGGIELSFESNGSPLWRTGSFLFASTVAGLELVTNVFWEMSKGEAVKANLQPTAASLPASPGPRPPTSYSGVDSLHFDYWRSNFL